MILNTQNNKTYKSLWFFAGILFVITFALGVLCGNYFTIQKQITNDDGQVQISKVLNLYNLNKSTEVDFAEFWDVWKMLKEKHVTQPVNDVDLFYGAMKGLVAGLNDPYSIYFPPEEAKDFMQDLSGKFAGIGAEVGLKDNQLTVIAPLPGSPAEKAGLKAGDKIFKINNEDSFGLSLDEAIKKIRGPQGSEVRLLVNHLNQEKIEEIVIVRDIINIPSVVWKMLDNKVAYLQISYFNENTTSEFDKIVKEIVLANPKSLILDMRNNPGGYLESAVSVASEWIKQGIVVSEKDNKNQGTEYQTLGDHKFLGLKTIVLVDGGTASGAEIVAGALQDYNLAKIVGEKTYGKGSVQDLQFLPDGSAVKITIANWYTPKERQINKNGIMPDVVVEKMFEEIKDSQGIITYKDLGLAKALELLK
ncbi:MAG: Carboxyl-terminal protease [Candidatus Magasanikbacteria bacterium GW2011_GWC2_37_14]|uniref:Carboxyl-terminal protease n=1 Tax=Candidatus Magasanikbacteria bacterium GW2011_GWC2_37_14 TaxID=1619046 RepID=A0A0G0ISZ7_9BACT|nr:MAG: Carboxyl-terminal protease [Candidatus Magasanikbacteria bacterium GW2011_GWC2_37_14]